MSSRNERSPEGLALQCSEPGCGTACHVVKLKLCLRHYARLRRSSLPPDPLLLLDDEIVDEIAVETLTHGWRVVRATWTERALATAAIIGQEHEDTAQVVSDRLGIPLPAAYRLMVHVQGAGNIGELVSVPVGDMSTTNPVEGP